MSDDRRGGHTKGPWFVNPVDARVEVPGRDAPICALLWPTDLRSEDETFSNARVIAAAPELLAGAMDTMEALKLLRVGLLGIAPEAIGMIDAHVDKLQFAIAKATGNQP